MWEVKGIPMHYIHKGESLEDWEPFAIEQGSLGTVIVCRRQVKPEGQKIQDEPDVGVGARMRLALERNHQKVAAQIDHEILTAPEAAAIRAQAIKDVAKFISLHCGYNNISYIVHRVDVESFKKGVIPE